MADGLPSAAVAVAIQPGAPLRRSGGLLAFLGLLPFWGTLDESGRTWWLWTCLAGFGLGLCGLEYCRRRRKERAAQQAGHR